MCLCFLLLLSLFLQSVFVFGQESYGAYAGLPVEGINGAGIAGNGANLDREAEIAQGVNIRKAPIAPVAPPRVPIPFSFGDGEEMSAYRRAPPPPTRRETRSEGKCQFDPNKWRIHSQSAIANAIMFDRTSGLQCDQCLELCTAKYQDPSNAWVCRSVTYDHRWKICDLFAVNGTTSPYFLVDFKGRDYFDFLPALPPSDSQLNALPGLPPAQVENGTPSPSAAAQQQLVNLTERDAVEDGAKRGERSGGQCLCPCKLLADKTAHFEPNGEQILNGTATAVDTNNDVSSNTPSPVPTVISAQISDTASENASSTAVSSDESTTTSIPPLTLPSFAEILSETSTISATLSSDGNNASSSVADAEPKAEDGGTLAPPPSPPSVDPIGASTSAASAPPPSPASVVPAGDAFSSPVSEPPNDLSLLVPEANTTTTTANLPSSATPPPETTTSPIPASSPLASSPLAPSSSDDSNVAAPPAQLSNASSEAAIGHRALSSKTFQQQSFREIRVPFHKTMQKLNKMGPSTGAKRGSKIHEVLKACPKKGQLAHYIEVSDHQRLLTARRGGTNSIEEIGAKDVAECMDACDAPIRLSICNSAVFSAAHRCELSTSAANHSAPDSLLAAPKFKYAEKLCLDASLSRGDDKRRVFSASIGYILVGHVQEVFNAGSLSECVKACLMAESNYGFVCKSLMFYPTDSDQNCLMNSESRFTQSDVFVQEDQNVHMFYVDMEQPRRVPPPSPLPLTDEERRRRRFKDIPIGGEPEKDREEEQQWTRWSKCLFINSSAAMLPEMRHRYQKCPAAKDIRKCPKESVPCRKMPKSLRIQRIWKSATEQSDGSRQMSDCLAVKDALGRKRCPYGLRWIGSQREFCSKPIDC